MFMNWLLGITSALAEEGADAAAAAATALPEGEQTVSAAAAIVQLVVPLVLMGLVFYFLLIRPQRKKDKKVKAMLDALKPGDRVTTIGGIYGTITAMKDDTITLAMGGQQNPVVIARWAIRSVEDAPAENDQELSN